MKNASVTRALCVLGMMLSTLIGCGDGASTDPTVTIKLSTGPIPPPPKCTTPDCNVPPEAFEGFGSLSGKITFNGQLPSNYPPPPLAKKGMASKDKAICAATKDIPNEEFLVGPDGGIKNVFVYLAKVPKGVKVPEASSSTVDFDQKECRFLAHALIVRTGQTILVKSDDAVAHNTHTYPVRNGSVNFSIAPNFREGSQLIYKRPEGTPFEVKCDIHPWMKSFHLALDHPYFAVTAEDGMFEIPKVPAGKLQFRVWHEKADGGFLNRKLEVTIEANKPTTISESYGDEDEFDL